MNKIMNEEATIKIWAKLQMLENDLQKVYTGFFDGIVDNEQMTIITDSIENDIKIHYYIYNLILKDARQN